MSTLLQNKLRAATIPEITDFMNKAIRNDICDAKAIWDLIGGNDEEVEEIKEEPKIGKWSLGDKIKLDNHTATVVYISLDYSEAICCMDEYWEETMDHKDPFLLRLNQMVEKDEKFMQAVRARTDIIPWQEEVDGKTYDRIFRVPYVEEMFDHPNISDFEWCREHFEDTNQYFWPSMIDSHNRCASRLNEPEAGWLMDRYKDDEAADFANVINYGLANYRSASYAYGVRLVFRLKNGV